MTKQKTYNDKILWALWRYPGTLYKCWYILPLKIKVFTIFHIKSILFCLTQYVYGCLIRRGVLFLVYHGIQINIYSNPWSFLVIWRNYVQDILNVWGRHYIFRPLQIKKKQLTHTSIWSTITKNLLFLKQISNFSFYFLILIFLILN